jgi:NADH pyrophosphatase NudC (nudix superfamily)
MINKMQLAEIAERLINLADKAPDSLNRFVKISHEDFNALISAAQTIYKIESGQLVELVHAYRIDLDHDEMCSNCGSLEVPYGLQYCPNCGAKMDGERKDGAEK